ncbi:P27 family phage terminase small subunit [Alcaligenaceae bacterium]|nr:P27 family phage terminase small subunit [Alcaligenaceae bacterium]
MASHLQLLPAVDGGVGEGVSGKAVVPSEIPSPVAKLTAKEKRVWEHVTGALLECGLIHRTDAMMLTVICRTFIRWVEAEEQLTLFTKENKGTYIVATPNGYEQPHQLFYVVRTLKRELLQWLPEAALTIPAFQKLSRESAAPEQGSLFDDPVEAHKRRKTGIGMKLV